MENNAARKTKRSFTPHELVKYHMEHPDEPITNEDMENLDLGDVNTALPTRAEVSLTPMQKVEADELADNLEKNSTGMSYKADI